RIVCPNCSAWLVTHKSAGELRCHHCGHNSRFPTVCPSCQTEGMIMPCGPGVERLSEEVELRFPDARQGIFSSDAITTPALAEQFFNAVYNDEIDIIIGTQMVAKGHHFPDLTLGGVVDADLGLGGADLRGGELSWQLLTQVAGRAGRESRPGQVLLQTAMPEAMVLQSLIHDDRESFIAAEKAARREAAMPPYGRLAAVILSGREEARLMMMAKQMANDWPHFEGVTLLGPAPAPLRLLRRNYRVRFLLKSSREVNLQRVISSWLDRITIPSAINCQVDIDPVSFF
ncbi:primosomal protein N', partial [Alphaproteobacteria bacterium]|nr:primosomal protein N' [Alphaproteobacteria bacterium]